jgi:hypothetical protein
VAYGQSLAISDNAYHFSEKLVLCQYDVALLLTIREKQFVICEYAAALFYCILFAVKYVYMSSKELKTGIM